MLLKQNFILYCKIHHKLILNIDKINKKKNDELEYLQNKKLEHNIFLLEKNKLNDKSYTEFIVFS